MLHSSINKVIIVVAIAISSVFLVKYGSRSYTFYGDALGYYMYLPATFIYHNVTSMAYLPEDKGIDWRVMWSANVMKEQKTKLGKSFDQYTYGIAFMEMPFFVIAHLIEKMYGATATGYTDTYQYLIKISAIFYAILGLILIYKVLKKYFTATQALLGVTIIFLGTNLFWFSLHQAGMSHVPLFFLYALLIYLVIKVHEQPKTVLFIAIGCSMGMITLIRPSDILCLLIPLLYNVYDKPTALQKIRFIKEHRLKIMFLIIAFVIPVIPQLLYWKAVSGNYFFYSYGTQTFNWLKPKIIEGLFYFSNGWLPYSPVMIFSVIGFVLYKQYKKWAWCIWIIFPVYVYIIYSWYCTNYINGLGSRPMIHLYPLLAIPLTAFIGLISKQRFFVKLLFASLCLFFISMNVGYSIQESLDILKSAESNMAYNLQLLYRTHLEYRDLIVYDVAEKQPDDNKVAKVCTLDCENFDDSVSDHFIKDTIFNSKYLYQMKNEDYSPGVSVVYNKQQFKDAKWFKCSGKFMYTQQPDYFKHLVILDIGPKLWKACKIENKINEKQAKFSLDYVETNKWGVVSYYIKIPWNLKDGDVIKLFIWNAAKSELFMDDLCLELYK